MSFIAYIPAALISREKWEDFLLFLRALPVDPSHKKYCLIEWCRLTGVALTHEMVEAVLGPIEVRG